MINRRSLLTTAAAFAVVPHAARAENVDFAKKTITIYIGNTAGGSYDLYGRMVARFLGKHLPGTPNVVASNMPGAGSLKAANFIYDVAPKDGTALGIVTETIALEQALANPAVQYDALKFTWIGRVASSNNIHVMWNTSKVQSVEDAKKIETPVAGTGAGNIAEIVPNLLNKVIGTKFKIISGYPASNEAMLAMERGEVEGAVGSWAAYKVGHQDWIKDKKAKVILQDVPQRSPELPDVPCLVELGRTEEERQLLGLYASGGEIGRAILAPPAMPPEIINVLRDGFVAMTKDPEFIAEMKKVDLDLDPRDGAALQAATQKILNVPESIKERAKSIFGR
jgi:tripartite-type tricarboxylate transporter receptor subunit TctC